MGSFSPASRSLNGPQRSSDTCEFLFPESRFDHSLVTLCLTPDAKLRGEAPSVLSVLLGSRITEFVASGEPDKHGLRPACCEAICVAHRGVVRDHVVHELAIFLVPDLRVDVGTPKCGTVEACL